MFGRLIKRSFCQKTNYSINVLKKLSHMRKAKKMKRIYDKNGDTEYLFQYILVS